MNFEEFAYELFNIDDYAKISLEPSHYHEHNLFIELTSYSKTPKDWYFLITNESVEQLLNDLDLILKFIKDTLSTDSPKPISKIGHDVLYLTSIDTRIL